jgi:hypothetical protein
MVSCFPQNSKVVSLILTTLLNAGHGAGDWHIALRSGGHSSPAGTNNIVNDVTIDLSRMNSSHYDRSSNTARLEPGGRWEDIYGVRRSGKSRCYRRRWTRRWRRRRGLSSWRRLIVLYRRMGFACDSVINYEVVLCKLWPKPQQLPRYQREQGTYICILNP